MDSDDCANVDDYKLAPCPNTSTSVVSPIPNLTPTLMGPPKRKTISIVWRNCTK